VRRGSSMSTTWRSEAAWGPGGEDLAQFGLMGESSAMENVLFFLTALESILFSTGC